VAGWSLGGAIARVFAGNFPDKVSGLLLVDPVPPDFYARAAREFPDVWSEDDDEYMRALYTDASRRAEQREASAHSSSLEQARDSDRRHAKPTTVLIAGRDRPPNDAAPIAAIWIDELKRWAASRPGTQAIVVPGSDHHIARDRPEAVVAAARELVNRLSKARPR
jgi:pimeloyl-ACP methyl ester carboxylesterase